MNRRVDFTQLDGIDLSQDLADFMQQSYRDAFSAIVSGLGDLLILYGVIDNGNNTSSGWVLIGGEMMPFIGSASATYVYVDTLTGTDLFGDGSTRTVEYTKVARLTSVQGSNYLFSDFRPFKTDGLNVNDSEVLATAKAVKLLKDEKDTDVAALQALIDAFGYLGKGQVNIADFNTTATITVQHNLNIQVLYYAQVTLQSYNSSPATDANLFFVTHSFLPDSFKISFKENSPAVQNVRANYLLYKQ